METLGEYLKEVRNGLKVSKNEVAKKTSINLAFLEDLETGNYKNLPADVYVHGFLKKLATLYGMEVEVVLSQYNKEKILQNSLTSGKILKSGIIRNIFKNFVLTPKIASLIASAVFVVFTLCYVIWQVLSINRTPILEIIQPQDRSVIVGSYISVKGKTEIGASLTVNGESVFVDVMGNFNAQLSLVPGPKELVFTAKNKFDKSLTKKVHITGQYPVSDADAQLLLRLDFFGSVDISYSIDSGSEQPLSFQAGEIKIFNATKTILLSTSDAGSTRVNLNGRDLGFLGRSGEKLKNIPFFAESDTIK